MVDLYTLAAKLSNGNGTGMYDGALPGRSIVTLFEESWRRMPNRHSHISWKRLLSESRSPIQARLVRWAGVVCSLFLLVSTSGCLQRRMIIRSYPEGALVHVDQQEVGYTPISVPFTYYGAHRILIEKDGFETVEVDEQINPPWYQIPPFDFIAENFWPREIRDERIIEFQLQPQVQMRESDILERAQMMRDNVSQGLVTPLLDESLGSAPAGGVSSSGASSGAAYTPPTPRPNYNLPDLPTSNFGN